MLVVLSLSAATGTHGASVDVGKNSEAAFGESRALNGATISPDAYDKALQQWRALPSIAAASVIGTVWTAVGPSPIVEGKTEDNGRVSAIAINPNNPNLIYAGASGGGVWRTTDGGLTWTPLYDQQLTLGVGEPSSIAIDPSNTNTIYVGTSDRFVKNISKGILKSADGGGSWIVLGDGFPVDNTGNADDLFAGQQVNVIVVDPANSNILYLGASNGLFRSIDGGRNWTQGTNGFGDARSLVLDRTSPAGARRLYAGVSSSGVRQSTDGGQTWTQILSTATPAVAAALPVNSTIGQVLVDLAPPTSPANPAGIQVLYVSMQGACTVPGPPGCTTPLACCGVNDPLGLFRSTDQGATWNRQTSAGIPTNTQGGYSFSMSVDPASPGDGTNDIIYLGAVGAAKSTDSGNNFAPVGPGIHVDSHSTWVFALQPSPTPSIVLTGNDGGIWKSTDGGATWSGTGGPAPTINAGGMQTALFYNLDIKNDATGSVTVGSTQDNGTPRTTGGMSWTDTQGGDGWDVGFDSQTTNNAYNSSGFWPAPCTRVFKSTDGIATFPPTVPNPADVTPWGTTTDQACGLASVNTDPSMADIVYVGGSQNLWQTRDGGSSWRIILNQGRCDVKVARANSNNVVAASGTQVFVSTNALAGSGVAFTNITRNLPPRSISRVEFDPNDPTIVYAVLSGFNNQTLGQPGHAFRTTIVGSAWTDISPTLDVPFNAIVLDGVTIPSSIYVGTDLGVLRSVDGGTSWSSLNDVHLPNVPVTDLVLNRKAGMLRAATFGRGVFEFALPTGPVIAVNAENGLRFTNVCGGATARLTLQVYNVGTQDLRINSVQRLNGSTGFTVLPNPSSPLIISPNAEVDFTVQYTPTTITGVESALIRISSNDPSAPSFDILATADPSASSQAIRVTGSTAFGGVCAQAIAEKTINLCNVGGCDLHVVSVQFEPPCPDFVLINSPFPATISHDACLALTIRFSPTSSGSKSCTLVIRSDDPQDPVHSMTVMGTIPLASIGMPPDVTFPPTVIQSAGSCSSTLPFPISNTGSCLLKITNLTLSGVNADEFSFVGPPSFPILLEPGHAVGEGDFNIVFMPKQVARGRVASVSVTYVSDPATGSTATVTRALCGEGVRTGVRILVTNRGVPVPIVKMIRVRRINANAQQPELNTVSVQTNLPLQTVTQPAPCVNFQYHREMGAASTDERLLAGVYDVTATLNVTGANASKSVGFDLRTCDFQTVVVNFDLDPSTIIAAASLVRLADDRSVTTNRLIDVHPNPARGSMAVGFNLAKGGMTRVDVFDVRGALVRTLVSGDVSPGRYEVVWDGHDGTGHPVGNGTYFVRFVSGSAQEARRSVLMR